MQVNSLIRLKPQPPLDDFWACIARVLMPVASIDADALAKASEKELSISPIITQVRIMGRTWYVASSLYWTSVVGICRR